MHRDTRLGKCRTRVRGVACRGTAPEGDLLLLEVAAVLLVDDDKVDVVLDTELRVHVSVCRGQVKVAQEQPHRDALALDRGTIHDLKLGQCLALVVCVWCWKTHMISEENGP